MGDLWRHVTGLSLVQGPIPPLLTGGAVLGLLVLGTARRSRAWFLRSVPLAVVAALVLLAAAEVALAVAHPFPDRLPRRISAWVAAALFALALAAAGWRRQRWPRRVAAALALLVVVAAAADQVDRVYAPFPTIAAALQLPPHDEVQAQSILPGHALAGAAAAVPLADGRPLEARWRPPAGMPGNGAVTEVAIPASRSGFTARPAWIYVPPAYLTAQRPLLPVLVLISGQPGSPRDWIDAGGVAETMDAFAAAHSGLAPVVVMPDALGAETANPLCMDSRLGKADTYLSVDVPAWIEGALQIDPDRAHWAVGGFSYGGTCALQLAVAHSDLFPTMLDIAGQQAPTLGDPVGTVASTFGGDQVAFAAVDPLEELATRRLPGSRALMLVGAHDSQFGRQAATVRSALVSAGVDVSYAELPGDHSWTLANAALRQAVPALAQRIGLTG
ncbi:Enterochelin esterase [Modestobacter sp. DSM 44400]|uniref:alpha/beta hydrolase n=1 Tax=Modestobacter sp. DSM 44400 TaxID=1550230 RepID=UPI0008947245|nr:alpha/beta hydrolase-fold protein [Modestobacter sp. DSM 44400]SDX55166.1 Enterochelin esterase [Modestobacter sp. DSM 44400]